ALELSEIFRKVSLNLSADFFAPPFNAGCAIARVLLRRWKAKHFLPQILSALTHFMKRIPNFEFFPRTNTKAPAFYAICWKVGALKRPAGRSRLTQQRICNLSNHLVMSCWRWNRQTPHSAIGLVRN